MTRNSINGALSAFDYTLAVLNGVPSTYPVYKIDSPITKTSNDDKGVTFEAPTGNGALKV